ncbi:hypothetical protein ABZV34_35065 [Streptomyces sp. NPDC005195]|uniref:hypothetical protein n=1 Tax=Streptomyces sp. NPDC005195 TaxID=3154561 RepID=UPI0033BA0D8F
MGFGSTFMVIEPEDVAQVHDLAARVQNLMDFQRGTPLKLPLGGSFFDIVVTAAGPAAASAVRLLDEIQRIAGARPTVAACGPVIEGPEQDWLIWLVPPGTHAVWAPNRWGICLDAPYKLVLAAMARTEPVGPYWLRPCRGDRFVPRLPLQDTPVPTGPYTRRRTPRPSPEHHLLNPARGGCSDLPHAAHALPPGTQTWHPAAGPPTARSAT